MRQRLSKRILLLVSTVLFGGLLLVLLANAGVKKAHTDLVPTDEKAFVADLAPLAQDLGKVYGIKPSVLIAQASLETNYGRQLLGVRYHNLYSTVSVDGRRAVPLQVQETVKGKATWVTKPFQVYPSRRAGMLDYLERLQNKQLGNAQFYQKLITAKSYKEASTAFILGGYTTDRDYADKLVAIIQKHNLEAYDDTNTKK